MDSSLETTAYSIKAAAFWQWFAAHELHFRNLENKESEQAVQFLDEMIRCMEDYHPGLKALAGPHSSGNYELIITSDGDVSLFCLVEDLVQIAPSIPGWLITAHKPALGFDGVSVELYGKIFNTESTAFYPLPQDDYPDEVDIVLTHEAYNLEEDEHFQAGGMLYLENGLGEINAASKIDFYETGAIPGTDQGIELIPLSKLSDYLNWREKEFVEKYESAITDKPGEQYYLLELQDPESLPVVALINTAYKDWVAKPAFPWLLQVDISFEGNEEGLPSNPQLKELQAIENYITSFPILQRSAHYLGNRTYQHVRSVYFYIRDYDNVSRFLHYNITLENEEMKIGFSVSRDKYWHSMEIFFQEPEDDEAGL